MGRSGAPRIPCNEWLTTSSGIEHSLLSMSLAQLERRCINNYVLNQENSMDQLLTSNDLRQLLSNTPKFLSTPQCLKPNDITNHCDVVGYRVFKFGFNSFVCKDYIQQAQTNSDAAGAWSSQMETDHFPYSSDLYICTKDFFNTSRRNLFGETTQQYAPH